MKLPEAKPSEEEVCLLKDSTVRSHCKEVEANFLPPYPASPVPAATTSQSWRKKDHAAADLTYRFTAGQQKSKTEPHAPEYFLNGKPWQLFRASMTPVLFSFAQGSGESAAIREFEKPIIGGVPAGAVVDLIIENTLNETVPLYKHGEPHWILGAASDSSFPYDTVSEAVKAGFGALNLDNPGLAIVHDLPPLGWIVVRFKAAAGVATMVHAVKLRMFAVSCFCPSIISAGFGFTNFVYFLIAGNVSANSRGPQRRELGRRARVCQVSTSCQVRAGQRWGLRLVSFELNVYLDHCLWYVLGK